MPMPNHCVECDKPTMDITCDKCKEIEDNTKICRWCGEADCDSSCPDEDDNVEAKTIGVEDGKN